jgi:hypothetical protein
VSATVGPVRRAAVLVALAGGLAAAAAPLAAGAGAPPLTRHTVPGVGVTLSVPSSWVAVDYREVLTQGVIDRLSRENPRLAFLFRALRQGGIKFVAADPIVRGGFQTNVNVVVGSVPAGLTPATYRQALVTQLGALPSVKGHVAVNSVTLPAAGPGLRLNYRLRLVVQGRPIVTKTLQYAFLRGNRSIVVTYTTTPASEGAYTSTFSRSANSIRLA